MQPRTAPRAAPLAKLALLLLRPLTAAAYPRRWRPLLSPQGVYHPMVRSGDGWLPNLRSRMLSEDVPCGLLPIKGAAEILGVPTPWMDRVISWAQDQLGKQYLVDGRLQGRDVGSTDAPQAYGVTTPAGLIISWGCPAATAATRPSPFGGRGARSEGASEMRREASSCAAELQEAWPHNSASLLAPLCSF